jgi:hypothetical protein
MELSGTLKLPPLSLIRAIENIGILRRYYYIDIYATYTDRERREEERKAPEHNGERI